MSKEVMTRRANAVKILLHSIGEDPEREGLMETPRRVARMYEEIFAGYSQDPTEILSKTFKDENHQEMVMVKDIEFYSHCEHHMVPFFGKAHIAYIPNGLIVGISKFARLVNCFGKRVQIQERMTSQIADTIEKELKPLGVMVVIEATHMCMQMRGVKNSSANTVTSAVRGAFKDNSNQARIEFLNLIR